MSEAELFYGALVDLVNVSGGRLGFMIVAAIFLGFIFQAKMKEIGTWFIISGIYIGFQEWMRILVLQSLRPGEPLSRQPFLIAVVAAPLFGLSIGIGAKLGQQFYNSTFATLKAEKRILEVIKEAKKIKEQDTVPLTQKEK